MARENQGLKGALIVFVLLTIVFAVVTAILFSGQSELKQKAEANQKRATEQENAARQAISDMEQLKKMMGYDTNDSLEVIQKGFGEDMQLYAANFPEETRFYRQTVKRQGTVLAEKNVELEASAKENADLKATLVALDTVAKTEIGQFSEAAKTAQTDRDTELQKFTEDRQRIEGQQQQLTDTLQQVRQDQETVVANINTKLDATNQELDKFSNAYKTVKGQIDDLKREKPDVFLGSVSWVNQRSGMVWLNLGRADALRPQTSFSVYDSGSSETSEVTKKASIKVTQVLGEHLAEAKILDDKSTNPILPGDKIFTPIWSLGEKRHFALAGVVDLDGDGKDDRDRLYSLIELNGGIVDARVDKDGKRQGEMTLNTRYLILGESPSITSSAELLKDFTDATREATRLNIETISLRKFLEMVGWKHESKVVDHNGSNDEDFSVEVDQSPTTSTGTISDLFQPRRPPRANGGSSF